MEIDNLGNYTQSHWFSNLTIQQFIRMYRALYEIWNFRAQLSTDVKLKICPFYSPFENITNLYIDNLTLENIQNACLIVFENMIFAGVDDDHRKLGTFHVLSALTIVSIPAREALPWLYESVAY